MTEGQWNEHSDHMEGHITWPATKEAIVAACNGEDVPAEVLDDVKNNLAEGTYNSSDEVKAALVH
ncbi:MAG TPA: DUF2795 domain-containing protein [Candidatus Nanoarchaeia archaeon]|nr:hypothetical protein [uncultured archaeon]